MARKLTDTQPIVLSNASQREDLSVPPLPDTFKPPGCAIKKSLTVLPTRGSIEAVESRIDDNEEQPTECRITAAVHGRDDHPGTGSGLAGVREYHRAPHGGNGAQVFRETPARPDIDCEAG